MSEVQTESEATAAALVGSLETFNLVDVLDLLARTGHTGELQVVGRGVDRRIWVDQGDMVDGVGEGGLHLALFDLACRDEGWFYFTNAVAVPEGTERLSISDTLGELGPQVEEWRRLVETLPAQATVCMAPNPPGAEVQIRGEQWQLLSMVGAPGRTVWEIMEASSLEPLVVLRTLQELSDAGLVTVDTSGVSAAEASSVPPPAPPGFATAEDQAGTSAKKGKGKESSNGAGAPVMPPPINGDPWSSSLTEEQSS